MKEAVFRKVKKQMKHVFGIKVFFFNKISNLKLFEFKIIRIFVFRLIGTMKTKDFTFQMGSIVILECDWQRWAH